MPIKYHWTHNGKTLTVIEWAVELKIKAQTLRHRHYDLGWDVERTLGTPLQPSRVPNRLCLETNQIEKGHARDICPGCRRVRLRNYRIKMGKTLGAKRGYWTFKGETLHRREWAMKLGIPLRTLNGRLNKLHWPVEKILSTAYMPKKEHRRARR